MPEFPVEHVRQMFPALHRGTVFLDNAAGAQIPTNVFAAIHEHLLARNVQRGGRYRESQEVDATIARARETVAVFLNAADPLLGSHAPETFSTDLLAAIIPGGHWRFAELTRPYWDALPGNIQESSVDVGFAVLAALIYLAAHRSNHLARQAAPWWAVVLGFWVLSLGPVLRIWAMPVKAENCCLWAGPI